MTRTGWVFVTDCRPTVERGDGKDCLPIAVYLFIDRFIRPQHRFRGYRAGPRLVYHPHSRLLSGLFAIPTTRDGVVLQFWLGYRRARGLIGPSRFQLAPVCSLVFEPAPGSLHGTAPFPICFLRSGSQPHSFARPLRSS